MMKKFTLLINGNDVDTGKYEYFPYATKAVIDFKTTRKIIKDLKNGDLPLKTEEYIYAKYCLGDEKLCQEAISAAYAASKIYKNFPLDKRRRIMGDIHDLLVENREEIIKLFIIEGHPLKLAEWEFEGMERGVAPETLDLYKEQVWKQIGKIGQETLYLARKADGVVCLNPPKNAPTSNSFVATGVLLSGNAIIVKPPLRCPISLMYVWKNIVNEALKRNGAPDGVVNIVIGNSVKLLEEWLSNPAVNTIFHFGESDRGIDIGKRAYMAGKKTILELSGNDMLFVWKDADIEKSTDALLDAFLGSTQICMVPKNAIIHEDIYDDFCKVMFAKVKAMKVGLPDDPGTCLSPVIKIPEYFEFLKDAKAKGAEIICGGRRISYKGEEDARGMYIDPTLVRIEDEIKGSEMLCIREENFFPLLPLLKINSTSNKPERADKTKDDIIFAKMVDMSENNNYGLRISAWIKSKEYINKFMHEMHNSGLLRINSRHVGFSLYIGTHGGTKKSGGPFGEMTYICERSSHLQGISVTEP